MHTYNPLVAQWCLCSVGDPFPGFALLQALLASIHAHALPSTTSSQQRSFEQQLSNRRVSSSTGEVLSAEEDTLQVLRLLHVAGGSVLVYRLYQQYACLRSLKQQLSKHRVASNLFTVPLPEKLCTRSSSLHVVSLTAGMLLGWKPVTYLTKRCDVCVKLHLTCHSQ